MVSGQILHYDDDEEAVFLNGRLWVPQERDAPPAFASAPIYLINEIFNLGGLDYPQMP
jgi:hypothetical protein